MTTPFARRLFPGGTTNSEIDSELKLKQPVVGTTRIPWKAKTRSIGGELVVGTVLVENFQMFNVLVAIVVIGVVGCNLLLKMLMSFVNCIISCDTFIVFLNYLTRFRANLQTIMSFLPISKSRTNGVFCVFGLP